MLPPHRIDKDILMKAVGSGSVECCKLLVEHNVPIVEITKEHLNNSLYSTDAVLCYMLERSNPRHIVRDELLLQAVNTLKASKVRILLAQSVRVGVVEDPWHGTFAEPLACVKALVQKADSFGSTSKSLNTIHWQERVARIEWLQTWIKKHLEGNQMDMLNKVDVHIEALLDTLYALFTMPIYGTPANHKKKSKKLLKASLCLEERFRSGHIVIHKVTALELAQRTSTSTTFADLFDPAKIKQWNGAIDRAYSKQQLEDPEKDAFFAHLQDIAQRVE